MAPPQGEVVGRDDELATARGFLATEGFGALVLEGEAGIGKTTLWRQAVAYASADGARVLVAEPSASETGFAFSGLSDLLGETLAETLAELPRPQAVALETALQLRDPEGAPPKLHTVAAGVLSVLRTVSEAAVAVVAVDDVQWLDRESATALQYAFRRLDEERVRADRHGARRSRRRPPGVARRHAVRASDERRRRPSQHRRHASRDPAPPRSGVTQARAAADPRALAGGNPFYALELARSLPDDPRPGVELPPSLEGLTRQRLTRLPAPVRRVLEPAALLAEPTVASARGSVHRAGSARRAARSCGRRGRHRSLRRKRPFHAPAACRRYGRHDRASPAQPSPPAARRPHRGARGAGPAPRPRDHRGGCSRRRRDRERRSRGALAWRPSSCGRVAGVRRRPDSARHRHPSAGVA